MDARQSFKLGFIARCIEAGLTTPAEITKAAQDACERLEKSADFLGLGGAAKALGNVAGTTLSYGLPLLAAGPPIVGAAVGHLAGKATDIDDFDSEEAKRQEIIDEYHRQAARAKRTGLLRRYEDARGRSGQAFL